jgi:2-methylcitrate dehydratase PrpD
MTTKPARSLVPSATRRFAIDCLGLSYPAIPAATRARAKLILLDTLGAMLSASRPVFPGPAKLLRLTAADHSDGPCLIVGTGIRTTLDSAALVNGYLGYALDIESHHAAAIVHAAAVAAPAALVVAQHQSRSGADLLTAMVLGIDVTCRVSLALGPSDLYARGFNVTAVCGTFGAAAAAGWLFGLDVDQFEATMGLAATQASGLMGWTSDPSEESRPFNVGLAARSGITAARCASAGLGAPQAVFDDTTKFNVFRAWSLDGKGSPGQLFADFGQRFATDELVMKRYACCAFLHPALDGLLAILNDEGLSSQDIETIVMRFPKSGAPTIDANPLRSHCAQYILALACVRRAVSFEDVLFDRSADPGMNRLLSVISVEHDEELDRHFPDSYATAIEIAASGRRRFSRRVQWPKGSPQNPLDEAELIDKFFALAAQRIGRPAAERIAAIVQAIETHTSGELIDALSA